MSGELAALAQEQAGVVSLAQLRGFGLSVNTVRAAVNARRWSRPRPGVIVTFTGPPPPLTRIWIAVLACGDGAALSHRTAAWLGGILPTLDPVIDVTIPVHRRIRPAAGIRVHRSHDLAARIAPGRGPRRIRAVDTVADLIAGARSTDAVAALVSTAVSGRHCTAAALRETLANRPNLRHRAAALGLLADVAAGAHSPLEVRYFRAVERAHGLPPGQRQAAVGGARVDVRYPAQRVRVELDGRRYHADAETRFRDLRRDNTAAVLGDATLRFGWQDVTTRPCSVAAQVATTLRRHDWTGQPHRCRSGSCGAFAG